ncbi:MAG: Sapep family Mn(2+)-dependent dipeptidase [Oscillospiraceae bacterium]|nr:Sapep family Mn(2+)-dependent dipeptidase [Oscillospiraceae bacterium]
MSPAYRVKIERYLAERQPDMLRDLRELISIPSTRGEALEGMPYGVGPRMALRKAMELMEREGLTVRNCDDRVCTGDLTALDPGLDILAHLDVVPAENNWTACPPYEPTLVADRLYGRGAIDDKGPAVAALYAMACVKALGVPLKKNVRLILGTDEECGSSDVAYYYTREQEAPMTFTPDANFPLINLEKGRLCGEIDASFPRDDRLPYLASAECGLKSNVIPETARAVIVGIPAGVLRPYLDAAAEKTGAGFTAAEEQGAVEITCKGVSGHAAYPEAANNALTALLHLLASLPCAESAGFQKLKALQALFPHGDHRGQALGIAMEDELSGYLTCSADLLRLDETSLYLCFDSRCPVCSNDENTRLVAEKRAEDAGLVLRETKMVLPHYVNADSDFVRTLLQAYEDWTGKPGVAEATGGGTYVHDLRNGVAFGCEMDGLDNHLHGADEFITLEQLMLSAKIFTQAILDLCG